MTNNDVLARLRTILDFDDAGMVAVFAAADHAVTEDDIRYWLFDEEHPLFASLLDRELALFLNGLIILKRGKREGPQPVAENRLTNNLIATKLRIAFNLKGEDLIRILASVDFELSNHELSAFFRKPGHKHFRQMNDQAMRKLLQGLKLQFRPK